MHTYIHTYMHTYIYTYIHTFINTYIHQIKLLNTDDLVLLMRVAISRDHYIHTYIHTYIHQINLLNTDDLVLLMRVDTISLDQASITLATVATHPEPLTIPSSHTGPSPACISVSLRFMDGGEDACRVFADPNAKYIMFDVRAAFFSFKPILEALQVGCVCVCVYIYIYVYI